MNKRSKVWAILGAGVLTLGVVGVALAIDLKDAHQGITIGWDENGDPFNDGGIEMPADCDGIVPGVGEIAIHFVQSGQGTNVNGTTVAENLLDVDFTGADDQTGVEADSIQNDSNVDWYVWTSSAGGDVVVENATSNVPGGDDELRISHICVGGEPGDEPSDEPSFEQSQEGETDAPSDVPSFEQSQEGETDSPTEPPTSTLGSGTAPADGAWLLVVALGVLLASVVVLTPARAKSRR